MFHLEMRQFPHNACQFNLSEAEMFAIVLPWAREEWIELGERKWNPHQARLKVIEGPHLDLPDLAMGRGWKNALHQGEDITDRAIAAAREFARRQAAQTQAPAAAPTTSNGQASGVPDDEAPTDTPSSDAPSLSQAPATAPTPRSKPAPEPADTPSPATPTAPATPVARPGAEGASDGAGELAPLLGDDPAGLLQAWRLAAERRPELSPSECLALAEATLRSLGGGPQ